MKGFTKKRNGQFLAAKRHSLLAGFAVMFIAAIFSLLAGMAVIGCGSTGPATQSSVPVDPNLIGTWIYCYSDNFVDVLTFNADNTALFLIREGADDSVGVTLQVRDGGSTLVAPNGSKMGGKIESGKYIMTSGSDRFDFVKAAETIEVANTTWAWSAPDNWRIKLGVTYTFAEDGTYGVEYTPGESQNIPKILALYSIFGVDGSGTYSVSGYKVILKPNGGKYISVDSDGNNQSKDTEVYTIYAANGSLFLDGLEYHRR